MSIRDKPTYLSYEVWRALWLLARAENGDYAKGSDPSIATADSIADQMLRQAIREQHPQLFEHQAKIDKLERELVATLQKK